MTALWWTGLILAAFGALLRGDAATEAAARRMASTGVALLAINAAALFAGRA